MRFLLFTPLFSLLFVCLASSVSAQTPTDAITMDKNQICNALLYTNSSWSEYWEGTLRRSNENIGTNVTQSVMYMANYGITKRLNIMAGLPYIWTRNTQGHWAGQRGIQDLGLWVKYRALDQAALGGQASLLGTVGGSTPLGNYVPDLLPMSIGMGCSTFSGRLIGDYRHNSGAYLTAQGGYTFRSNSKSDRDAYQFDGEIIYSNQIAMPNMADYSVNLGFRRGLWNVAVNYNKQFCVSGDDIRRNDAPFPTNNMDATSVGAMVKFHARHLGFVVNANQIFDGRNMGRATTIQGGILYAFYAVKPKE